MNHLVREMVAYYHESGPHQAKDNDLLVPAEGVKKADEPDGVRLSDIRCKKRLGGLLKHYYRKSMWSVAGQGQRCAATNWAVRGACSKRVAQSLE
jgi:hypothetical protein